MSRLKLGLISTQTNWYRLLHRESKRTLNPFVTVLVQSNVTVMIHTWFYLTCGLQSVEQLFHWWFWFSDVMTIVLFISPWQSCKNVDVRFRQGSISGQSFRCTFLSVMGFCKIWRYDGEYLISILSWASVCPSHVFAHMHARMLCLAYRYFRLK